MLAVVQCGVVYCSQTDRGSSKCCLQQIETLTNLVLLAGGVGGNITVENCNCGEFCEGEQDKIGPPPALMKFLDPELPICKPLDLDPEGVWESTNKFSAKSAGGEWPSLQKVCFCLIK